MEFKKPKISESTMQSMWEFFLRTSLPRIIAKGHAQEKELSKSAK